MPVHSHHIFVLPFRWDKYNQKHDFATQQSLKELHHLIGDQPMLPNSSLLHWERQSFDWSKNYNEAIYFHPFVREMLFDNEESTPGGVLQYHISEPNMEYRIQLKNKNQKFVLSLEKITLSFYEMGIGMLAFSLNNEQYSLPDDILLINDYGRRIFPQFLGYKPDISERLADTKDAILADNIEIWKGNDRISGDDFINYSKRLSGQPKALDAGFLLPNYIRDILPNVLSDPELYICRPVFDDRMYVVCWVASEDWDIMCQKDRIGRSASYWHSLIFVDGSINSGIENDAKMQEYNRLHTYRRWTGKGIYYGICRYSFIIRGEATDWYHTNVLIHHTKTMYLQLAQISLLQRAYIVRFSEKITEFSHKVSQGYKINRHSAEVRALYSQYLHFINKVYFREVTPQEQGIELYKMIQDNMEIERDVKALQQEINEFSRVLDLESGDRQSDALNTLTIVGAGLAVPSLILAYYGTFNDKMKEVPGFFSGIVPVNTFLGLFAGVIAGFLWVYSRTWDSLLKNIIRIMAIALVFWVFYRTITQQ